MRSKKRAFSAVVLLIAVQVLLLNCNTWSRIPTGEAPLASMTGLPQTASAAAKDAATDVPPAPTIDVSLVSSPTPAPPVVQVGEPAGCLAAQEQAGLRSVDDMLGYADKLLGLPKPLSTRLMPASWALTNGHDAKEPGALSLTVAEVQNTYLIQHMLDALHVAGFVTWLRDIPSQGLHILAIPLLEPGITKSAWAAYIDSYWQSPDALPAGDLSIRATPKLPPCAWMVTGGFAPKPGAAWQPVDPNGWPDYASAAAAYLASTDEEAVKVARRINWLGDEGREGPNTMCGPLAWSILNDAGALPQGWGGWSDGARSFWLGKPRTNGRPWSLFPAQSYHLDEFHEQLGKFDFSQYPLYPGDFIYTYSEGNGFDHMLIVTEVDNQGNVYTVTNLTQVVPDEKTTIERVLFLNLNDPTLGIARNAWANDRANGRTGHSGFDVFRWAWMQKDITHVPAEYVVEPGDTLGRIALAWKTHAKAIAVYNGIGIDSDLVVGQVLSIPPND